MPTTLDSKSEDQDSRVGGKRCPRQATTLRSTARNLRGEQTFELRYHLVPVICHAALRTASSVRGAPCARIDVSPCAPIRSLAATKAWIHVANSSLRVARYRTQPIPIDFDGGKHLLHHADCEQRSYGRERGRLAALVSLIRCNGGIPALTSEIEPCVREQRAMCPRTMIPSSRSLRPDTHELTLLRAR